MCNMFSFPACQIQKSGRWSCASNYDPVGMCKAPWSFRNNTFAMSSQYFKMKYAEATLLFLENFKVYNVVHDISKLSFGFTWDMSSCVLGQSLVFV